jgi:hypothetical protein
LTISPKEKKEKEEEEPEIDERVKEAFRFLADYISDL